VNHVRLNLCALVRAQASLRDREVAYFLRREHGLLNTPWIVEGLAGDFDKAVEFSSWQHRRLVCRSDELKGAFHLCPAAPVLLFEGCDAHQRLWPVHFHEELDLLALQLGLHLHVEIVKAVCNQVPLQGIEFFRFDQHILAHAYFSEVMQQRGITDFLHLLAREAN
jgi:hypothetical protein